MDDREVVVVTLDVLEALWRAVLECECDECHLSRDQAYAMKVVGNLLEGRDA